MDDDPFAYVAPALVASPCVAVCDIDAVTGWCIGCARTGDEIAEWRDTSDARRQAILDSLPARIEALRARSRRSKKQAMDR